jgi:hypothetical protein
VPLCLPVADRVQNAKSKAKTLYLLCPFVPACYRQGSKNAKSKAEKPLSSLSLCGSKNAKPKAIKLFPFFVPLCFKKR